MKTNALLRIVIFSLILVILLGVLLAGLGVGAFVTNVDSWVSDVTVIGGNHGNGSVEAGQIRNLDIDWVSGSISIQPGDTDQIIFSEDADLPKGEQLVWKQSGDTLTISFCATNAFSILSSSRSKDLTVTVPQSWNCSDLDITSTSASVNVNGMTTWELELKNVSGSCFFSDCSVEELSINTVSGNVEYYGNLGKSAECSTVSANCTIAPVNTPRELSLDSVSGDLRLYLPLDCGFTASMDSVSGGIASDFFTNTQNGKHTHGDGYCRIAMDSVSGDLVIRKAQ